MAKYVKSGGAYFEDTGSDYKIVSDVNIISSLKSGQSQATEITSQELLNYKNATPTPTPSVTPTPTPSVTPTPTPTPQKYTGTSIVDYLKSEGQASDYASRASLAMQQGIQNYRGTAQQNTQLLSLLRGGSATPTPTPSVTPTVTPTVDPSEQARNDAATKANEEAQTIYDNAPTDINMRESTKILDDITKKLQATDGENALPEPKSMVDLFNEEKAKLGIEPLETELAEIDADIDRINTELLVQAEEAGEKVLSSTEIGRAKGQLQKRADREIALLNVERSAVARILDNKMSTLSTIVNLTDMDYDNATDYYKTQYDQQIQLYNLVKGAEEDEDTADDKAKADATANLGIVVESLQSKGLTWETASATDQNNLTKMALQSGTPIEVIKYALDTQGEEEKANMQYSFSTQTDASGNKFTQVLQVNKDTGEITTQKVYSGGVHDPDDNNDGSNESKLAQDYVVSQLKDNPNITDEALFNDIKSSSKLSVTEINNAISEARRIYNEEKGLTKDGGIVFEELGKVRAGDIQTSKDNGIDRDTAENQLISQLKTDLGLGTNDDLSDQYKNLVADVIFAVYGGTWGQNLLPFGRGGLGGTSQEDMRKKLGL